MLAKALPASINPLIDAPCQHEDGEYENNIVTSGNKRRMRQFSSFSPFFLLSIVAYAAAQFISKRKKSKNLDISYYMRFVIFCIDLTVEIHLSSRANKINS